MKVLKQHRKLLFLLGGFVMIASVITLWQQMTAVLHAYYAYWLLPLAALIMVITPLGSRRLGQEAHEIPAPSGLLWLARIVLIELSLLAIFGGITFFVSQQLPIATPKQYHLLSHTLYHALVYQGLFPWTGIALLAATMGHYSYHHNRDSYFSTCFTGLFPSDPNHSGGVIINATARAATLVGLASTLAITVLFITSLITPTKLTHLTGTSIASMISLTIFILAVMSRWIRKNFYLFTRKTHLPNALFVWTLIVILTGLLLLLTYFLGDLTTKPGDIPHFVQSLLHHRWLTNWQLLANNWWLAWTPISAILIAKLSAGRTLRGIILATIAFPVIATIGIHLIAWNELAAPSWLVFIIMMLALYVIIALTSNKTMIASLQQAYLPQAGTSKHRSTSSYMIKLLTITAFFVACYLASGIMLVNVLTFVMLLYFAILMLLLPIAVIKAARS